MAERISYCLDFKCPKSVYCRRYVTDPKINGAIYYVATPRNLPTSECDMYLPKQQEQSA